MATSRSKTPDEPEQQPAATVRTQQYDAGTGWEVGQKAPEDAFRALSDQGTGAVTGPVVSTHPGGYARLIVKKGALVTEGVKRELDAAKAEAEQSSKDEG
jgi:hypothetical protein